MYTKNSRKNVKKLFNITSTDISEKLFNLFNDSYHNIQFIQYDTTTGQYELKTVNNFLIQGINLNKLIDADFSYYIIHH